MELEKRGLVAEALQGIPCLRGRSAERGGARTRSLATEAPPWPHVDIFGFCIHVGLDMSMPSTYPRDMSRKAQNADMTSPHWDPGRPYEDLPMLPPAVELETPAVLKACIDARSALAELKQATERIPNARVLLSCLPLLEAQASSEIENVVTTADELFRHLEAPESGASPATREALRYREALMEGFRALGGNPLGLKVANRVCSRIKAVEMTPRKVPGTALGNPASGKVIYTPPSRSDTLERLLSNWERYLHGTDNLDPLVRMAVGHYQFEAIHPYTDGNGRTGRILNSLFLVERGLIGAPVLYLSRHIIHNKTDYYGHLLGVTRDGSWEPWLLYMLHAVAGTSAWTLQKIEAIRKLIANTRQFVQAKLPKIYSAELVEQLFVSPYCRIQHLVDAGVAQRETASRYLKSIAATGVLLEQRHGREKLFVNSRLLALLTSERNDWVTFE
jgi:cell filamentation protein, protein adenylyltransferase